MINKIRLKDAAKGKQPTTKESVKGEQDKNLLRNKNKKWYMEKSNNDMSKQKKNIDQNKIK